MADPVFVDCPKDVWTKVATNVAVGRIHKKDESPQIYLYTYRETGGAVPPDTDAGKEQGVPMFLDGSVTEEIAHSSGIDIYVFPLTSDGKVRVDL